MSVASELAEKLRAAASADADIEVAALFGSAARERLRVDSDVDVYLRLCRGVRWSREREDSFRSDLERQLRRDVDLVIEDRNETSTILRMEVARSGVLAWERTPGAWTSLRAEAMTDYADLEPFMRRMGEGVRRRVRERLGG